MGGSGSFFSICQSLSSTPEIHHAALDINDVAALARKTLFACSSAGGRAPTFRRSPQRGLVLPSRVGLIFESASAVTGFGL
jgi:hypothetical protein